MAVVIEPRSPEQINADIIELVRLCHNDPLKFVLKAWAWGEPGWLEHDAGPDRWQAEFLNELGVQIRKRKFDGINAVMPIEGVVSSGHGVGKSVLAGMLVNFIMSTRPQSHGTVTANTSTQLETKTWATITRWTQACLTAHWFVINSSRMYHKKFPKSWFCAPQTCRRENSEAFAGQHARDSTSFYIFDEDSAIDEIIHVVAEGGMATGEPMAFRFGNATRNNGPFFEAAFGKKRDKFDIRMKVDSRTSRYTNKERLERLIAEHGEDSDYVRVRILGEPPKAGDSQFIPIDLVRAAQGREVTVFDDEPLIAGVDFSGGGQAWNVVRFRRGLDGNPRPAIRIPGEKTRNDRSGFLAILAELLRDRNPETRVSAMFLDSAFGAAYYERLRAMNFDNVHEIVFGATMTPDEVHYLNMRAYMWGQSKEWLRRGTIPEDDERFADDASAPGYHLNKKDQIVLESKEDMAERGIASPDDWDAFVLTFAAPVAAAKSGKRTARQRGGKRRTFAARGGGRNTPGGLGWMR